MSEYKVGDKFIIRNKVCEITKVVNEVLYDLDNNQRYIADDLKSYVKLPELTEVQVRVINNLNETIYLNDLADVMAQHNLDHIFKGVSWKDFHLALAYGYSVKKEKKYMIVDKRLEQSYSVLNYVLGEDYWFYGEEHDDPKYFNVHFTEQELRDAGFGHEFETMAVEVEE